MPCDNNAQFSSYLKLTAIIKCHILTYMYLHNLPKKLQVIEEHVKKRKSEVLLLFLLSELKMYKTHLWTSHLLLTTNVCHPRAIHSQKTMTTGEQSSAWISSISWEESWTVCTLDLTGMSKITMTDCSSLPLLSSAQPMLTWTYNAFLISLISSGLTYHHRDQSCSSKTLCSSCFTLLLV